MYDTNDPNLRSFIELPEDSHFPIQNLPYCVFRPDTQSTPRVGIGIGEYILDLSVLEAEHFFSDVLGERSFIFTGPHLNPYMRLGPEVWQKIRSIISRLLRSDEKRLRDDKELRTRSLTKMADALLQMPVSVGDYTDFYASREHASNLGRLFRGSDNPLLTNWFHLPVAYHGRASSIVLSPASIRRPMGQFLNRDNNVPEFGPSRQLDFELELGFYIGPENTLGDPIGIDRAPDHIFGCVLVNDWSARDIQKWEYQPLGPFLGKNFATSVSPWIVPFEALYPFRCRGPEQTPEPLPHLRRGEDWALDITLEIMLKPQAGLKPTRICSTNARYLYWNICQLVAHHTSNGCNLRAGDLLASGTISGADSGSMGSLIELTSGGSEPIRLRDGIERIFLEDGDAVIMTGYAQGDGYRVGFGEVTGTILPSKTG